MKQPKEDQSTSATTNHGQNAKHEATDDSCDEHADNLLDIRDLRHC